MTEVIKEAKTISTEQVFDMLPMVTNIYDKLEIEKYTKDLAEKNKDKKPEDMDANLEGINLFKYIFKNSKKVKEEVFEIVAVLDNKTVAEVKKQSIMATFNSFKELFADAKVNKEITDFFVQAVK